MSADTSTTMATPSPSPLSADGEKNVAVPAEAFTLFPKLATELRLKIWKLALPGPRVVVVEYSKTTKLPFSPARIPVILQVNRESRDEALKSYTLALGFDGAAGRIFFDFSKDILVLHGYLLGQTQLGRCKDVEEVQYITLHRSPSSIIQYEGSRRSGICKRMNSLKQLYFYKDANSNIHETRRDLVYEVQDVTGERGHERYWRESYEKESGLQVKYMLLRGMRGPFVIADTIPVPVHPLSNAEDDDTEG
jgi:2EXR family